MRLPKIPDVGGPKEQGAAGFDYQAPAGEVEYGKPAGFANDTIPAPRGGRGDPRKRAEKKGAAQPIATWSHDDTPEQEEELDDQKQAPLLRVSGGERSIEPDRDLLVFTAPVDFIKKPVPPTFPKIFSLPLEGREEPLKLLERVREDLERGDELSALSAADRLAEIAGEDPGVHLLRASILNRLERFAEAEAAARRAVAIDPSSAAAHRTLAWAQLKQGKFEEAQRSAAKAAGLDPTDGAAHLLEAFAHDVLGQRQAKLKAASLAASLNPAFQTYAQAAKRGQHLFLPPDQDAAEPVEDQTKEPPLSPLVTGGLLISALSVGAFLALRR